jgi:hypothetical protein
MVGAAGQVQEIPREKYYCRMQKNDINITIPQDNIS